MKKYRGFYLFLVALLIFMNIPITKGFAEEEAFTPMRYTSGLSGTDDIRTIDNNALEVGGAIYIEFSSEVKSIDPTKIHIYEMTDYNDTVFSYVYKQDTYVFDHSLKEINKQAKIVDKDHKYIEIIPEQLSPLTQYKLKLEEDAVSNEKGLDLGKDIQTSFWTKSLVKNTIPKWELDQKNKNDDGSYTFYNVDDYTMDLNKKPIELIVDDEVILNAYHQEADVVSDSVYAKDLEKIKIIDLYESQRHVTIEKVKISHYTENGKIKTKILLGPAYRDEQNPGKYIKKGLELGKKYQLSIPSELFETRGRKVLGELNINLLTKPDLDAKKTIHYLEGNHIKLSDLKNEEKTFSILGSNFHYNFKNVILKSAKKEVTIPKEDIELKDSTFMNVNIKGKTKDQLSQYESVGDYEVAITFEDSVISSVYNNSYNGQDQADKLYLHIEKGSPIINSMYPQNVKVDEKSLYHDKRDSTTEGRYFIKVTFDDRDGKLGLNGVEALKNCVIQSKVGSGNYLDTEFILKAMNMKDTEINDYVFSKKNNEAILYIPIKELSPQKTYEVCIPAGIVYDKDTLEGNDPKTWEFSTADKPLVTEVSIGSIPEDYGKDDVIYIRGNFFNKEGKVRVYFDDIEADEVVVLNEKELKVYLPTGRDHLDSGTYDIVVSNDKNHERIVYGSLSVIKAGDKKDIPNEEYKIKENGKYGEVRGDLKISKDTLLISPSDINVRELNVDLDEAMGTDTYIRKIWYEGETRYKIGMLKTKSKWADITLYGLTLYPYGSDDKIEMSLGRVEPLVAKTLKGKLRGKGVLSDFIQVSGKNFKLDNIKLSIPFKHTTAKNIKVLRYDEVTRNFYEEYATINLVDGKVELVSPIAGIFVVVN